MQTHPEFEIAGQIGRGPRATVYQASERATGRVVAIKAYLDSVRRDAGFLRRVQDRAALYLSANNPLLVPVLGFDSEHGWLMMDRMEGSLDTQVVDAPLPPEQVRGVLRQTLEALRFLHEQGCAHGSVKPGNLLIDANGRLRLGESSGLPTTEDVQRPTTTKKYIAPEVLSPEFGPAGPAADLYSLGFTALELLVGPEFDFRFMGGTMLDPEQAWARLHSARTESLPPINTLVPGVPEDLARVLDRLLVKERSGRYGSATEALADLGEATAVPLNPPKQEVKPVERLSETDAPSDAPTFGSLRPAEPPPSAGWRAAGSTAAVTTSAPPTLRPAHGGSGWQSFLRVLNKPAVLYPLCGIVIAATALLLIWPFGDNGPGPDEKKPVAVRIDSNPPGATVFLDGQEQKKKSGETFELKPGKYTVRLVLAGHKMLSDQIEVSEGGENKFPFALEKVPVAETRVVTINSEPAGARIFLNGEDQGKVTRATLELKPGKYDLKLTLKDHDDFVTPLNVPANGLQPNYDYTLTKSETKPTNRVIVLDTKPSGATVLIDGKDLGKPTPARFERPPGRYELKLSKPKHRDRVETLTVLAGKDPLELNFDLTPLPPPTPRSNALLAGVREVKGLPSFRFAESEIPALGRVLRASGYAAADVTVMTALLGEKDPSLLPTADRLRQKLGELVKDRNPGDTVILALSGHVVRFNDDDEREYFCPHGADLMARGKTLLPLREVFETLGRCSAGTKVVFLECREEGAKEAAKANRIAVTDARPWTLPVPQGVKVYFSCSGAGKGFVRSEEAERSGVFFANVSRGLAGDAAKNADRKVTLKELEEYVGKRTARYAEEVYKGSQEPLLLGTGQPVGPIASPHPALKNYCEGLRLMEQERYMTAHGEFIKVLQDWPGFSEAQLRRAMCRFHLNDFTGMLADAEQVCKDDPTNATGPDLRGDALVHLEDGKEEAARASYDEAIRLCPDFAPVYLTRAKLLERMGQKKEAMDDFDKAIDLSPATLWKAEFLTEKGRAFLGRKDPDKALENFEKAIKENPNYADAHYYRAFLLKPKDPQEALKAAGKAIDLYREAVKKYMDGDRLKERQKELTRGLYSRASINVSQTRYMEAIPDLREATELDSKYLAAYKLLVLCYDKTNQKTLQEQAQKKVMELGNDPDAKNGAAAKKRPAAAARKQ